MSAEAFRVEFLFLSISISFPFRFLQVPAREEAQIVTVQVCVVMIVVRFLGSCSETLG
jgi:hypothetical protein